MFLNLGKNRPQVHEHYCSGEEISDETLLYTACGTEGVVKRAVREIASTSSVMTIRFVSDGEGTGAGFLLGYAAFAPGQYLNLRHMLNFEMCKSVKLP